MPFEDLKSDRERAEREAAAREAEKTKQRKQEHKNQIQTRRQEHILIMEHFRNSGGMKLIVLMEQFKEVVGSKYPLRLWLPADLYLIEEDRLETSCLNNLVSLKLEDLLKKKKWSRVDLNTEILKLLLSGESKKVDSFLGGRGGVLSRRSRYKKEYEIFLKTINISLVRKEFQPKGDHDITVYSMVVSVKPDGTYVCNKLVTDPNGIVAAITRVEKDEQYAQYYK